MIKRLAVSEGREELAVEGSDLLLNSERGAGGVVVSKEEVAPDRKGSGGAWGSTSRNAGLAGPAPQNGRIRAHWRKTKQNIRSLGCGLQFGGAIKKSSSAIALQNSSTIFRHAVRAIQGA